MAMDAIEGELAAPHKASHGVFGLTRVEVEAKSTPPGSRPSRHIDPEPHLRENIKFVGDLFAGGQLIEVVDIYESTTAEGLFQGLSRFVGTVVDNAIDGNAVAEGLLEIHSRDDFGPGSLVMVDTADSFEVVRLV